MEQSLLIFTILFIFSPSLVYNKQIPDYIKVCKRNDPQVEKCVLNSIEKLRPFLRRGIPELDVPSMEPLILPEVVVSRGEDASRFTALGKNVKVYGGSDFKINKLKVDSSEDNKLTVQVQLDLPFLRFDGEYLINARILLLPLRGNGHIKSNATNTKADAIIYGQTIQKKGQSYMRFTQIDMDLKIGDYSIHLDNLFNGDRILGEATNAALNQNKREFMDALHPIVVRTVSELLLDVANKISKTFPYEELFPKK